MFAPSSRDRAVSILGMGFDARTIQLITSIDREPVPIEAMNVTGVCANGDIASAGFTSVSPEFPGRVHSYETGEILHEFPAENIVCFG